MYIEKMNIKESTFRILEVEFSNAQKYIDKSNQEKVAFNKYKEKYKYHIIDRYIIINKFYMMSMYRLHQEIITLKHKIHRDSTNLVHKDVEIQELKKEVNNWSDKLKDQNHELHTIKTEKNLFSKNLSEAKVSISIS